MTRTGPIGKSIYKTPEGRAALLEYYERRLAAAPIPVESRFVDTHAGATHLLAAGPEDAAPLVLVAGSNGSGLDLVWPFAFLAKRHRMYFLDVPGEPNRSSEQRMNKADDSLGRWMKDVLDGLGVGRAALLGISGGGYAVLRSATLVPERISRAVLLVPEGFARPRWLPTLRSVLWPLLHHRLSPTRENARRFAAGLADPEPLPEAAVDHLALIMQHVDTAMRLGPLFRAEELSDFDGPALVVAGGRDLIFPGDRIAARAPAVLRNLRELLLLPDVNHSSAGLLAPEILEQIGRFLAEDARP